MGRYRRAAWLLQKAKLPADAQRAAANDPDLRDALAETPGAMDADAWKAAYRGGVSGKAAGRLARRAVDASCVETLLETNERRATPLTKVLENWRLPVDAQMRLVDRAVPSTVADAIVTNDDFIDTAKRIAVARCSPTGIVGFADAGIDADLFERLVTRAHNPRGSETNESPLTIATWVADTAYRNPQVRARLADMHGDTVRAAESMLASISGDDARWDRLVAATASNTVGHHIAFNLLERPETPIEVKRDVWSTLSAARRAEAHAENVADVTLRNTAGVAVSDITDVGVQIVLLSGPDNRPFGARKWLWCDLVASGVLRTEQLRVAWLRLQRSHGRQRFHSGLDACEIAEARLGAPASTEVLRRRKARDAAAAAHAELAAATVPTRTGNGGGIATASKPPAPTGGGDLCPAEVLNVAGVAAPWSGRPGDAGAWLAHHIDGVDAWGLLFQMCETWDGTVSGLAEAVNGVCASRV